MENRYHKAIVQQTYFDILCTLMFLHYLVKFFSIVSYFNCASCHLFCHHFATVDNPYFTSLHNIVYFASQVLANLLKYVYSYTVKDSMYFHRCISMFSIIFCFNFCCVCSD